MPSESQTNDSWSRLAKEKGKQLCCEVNPLKLHSPEGQSGRADNNDSNKDSLMEKASKF